MRCEELDWDELAFSTVHWRACTNTWWTFEFHRWWGISWPCCQEKKKTYIYIYIYVCIYVCI